MYISPQEEARLRNLKKIDLASRISLDEEEFDAFLVSMNDSFVEEFFNKCHDEGGRFCGEGTGGRRPHPVGYIKQRAKTAIGTAKGRSKSGEVSRVTTGALRRILGGSTAYGSVKIKRLSKTNLRNFTDRDLNTIKDQLKSDQRRYNLMHNNLLGGLAYAAAAGAKGAGAAGVSGPAGALLGLAGGVTGAAVWLGLVRYKTKRIPGQIDRIDRELAARKSGGGSLSGVTVDFATGTDTNLPTLAQEIAQAKKDIESGNLPKVKASKPTADDLDELEKFIGAMKVDPEEGITSSVLKGLKDGLKLLQSEK